MIGKTVSKDDLKDDDYVQRLVQLSIDFAPHITLTDELTKAAEGTDKSLDVILNILRTAKIAELSSYGTIADNRLRIIKRVRELKSEPTTVEAELQRLIEEAPWLVNPEWAPIAYNQKFETLKTELESYYKSKTGDDLHIADLKNPTKKPDFVLHNHNDLLEVIEIKRPLYAFANSDFERMYRYYDTLKDFVNLPGSDAFNRVYRNFKITLVCDKIGLTGPYKGTFELMVQTGSLTHINWTNFIARTEEAHQDFLAEAKRLRSATPAKP